MSFNVRSLLFAACLAPSHHGPLDENAEAQTVILDPELPQFILDPLYKIYSQVLGEPESTVRSMLGEFGVYLKPSAYRQDVKPLLKDACSSIFGSATGLTDMMVRHFPSARVASASKVPRPR